MNTVLFNCVLGVFLIALSPYIYGAEAPAAGKQVTLHPRIASYLSQLSPLSAHTMEWLNSPEALSYRIHYGSGYWKPLLFDRVSDDGRFQEVHALLAMGTDVDGADSEGNTPITQSLRRPLQLQLLLDYKADVNVALHISGRKTRTLLSACCKGIGGFFYADEHRESLDKLLADPRIRVNDRDANGDTPLYVMVSQCTEKDLPCIKQLIDCGADPMHKEAGKRNVLTYLTFNAIASPKSAPLCKKILELFENQRKETVKIKQALQACEVLKYDVIEHLTATYLYPEFAFDPNYLRQLAEKLKMVQDCSIAS